MYSREKQLEALDRLLTIMDELRAQCPWDKKQTMESLRYLTIEETYELGDAILEAEASKPEADFILIVGDGINQLDASGEEVLHHMISRLRSNGVTVVFSGLKKQVLDTLSRTGLRKQIGDDNIFATADQALDSIYDRLDAAAGGAVFCPLRPGYDPDAEYQREDEVS